MGQVAAVGEVHPQHGVPRLQGGHVDRHVRLGAGVRLDVDVLGAEERFGARDGGPFGDIDEFAAAVVPPARVAFGVFVRHDRSGGFHDRQADEVLRGDELQAVVLPGGFVTNGFGDFRIRVGERAPHRDARRFKRHVSSGSFLLRRFGRGAADDVLRRTAC